MRRQEPIGPAPTDHGPQPLLRVADLVKSHHSGPTTTPAVRRLDLTVNSGDFIAIMGPSGAGKSSLLHLLGGLERPDSGRIWFQGRRVETLSEAHWAMLRRHHIGIVFQFFNLVSTMTVADNIELPALLAGASPRQARARARDLMNELGLTDKARATPTALSGGEQQRVALARALANEPALLLADEPTGNLDSRNTREVLRLLTRFHAVGRTIILVTHDARVAAIADRVLNISDGDIIDDAELGTTGPGPRTTVADIVELKG
ncbi:ABC transporter ATP-binding protein [Mangrovactinospora gilvigrisea]|uniref:ABC transporter ATP-binding protein n=1 Tax=Mangrovactinospora gilvigrisea TaxID=1428644 RepID=A0A1J7CB30_9ACTN|nr:ABC transporter ATP-binding protein [Mangrovactinospora gilvigrisea]OIV38732.1 ABC transporter ATP-binding protein [Mangrovactinospora gilvigrisea]